MCIILTCEKNVRPSYDLIETCFYNNPDGAGIMWCEDGRVQMTKGFDSVAELSHAIDATPNDSRLVIHMRIATSGGIDVGTCHPFPICDDLDILHAPDVECDAAIAHNGIIAGLPTDEKLGISDTVYFVSHYVNNLYQSEGLTKGALRRIKAAAPGNRFAIMTKDGVVHRLGNGWETVTKGIQASNATWRYEKLGLLSRGGYYYDSRWDDDWDDDWYGSGYTYSGYSRYGNYDYYVDESEVEDESDFYDPDYIKLFDTFCGDRCPSRADCMAWGAYCEHVADLADEMLAAKANEERVKTLA